MKLSTIELGKNERIQGYGYLKGPPFKSEGQNTLNALVEWSTKNRDKRIVHYFIREEEQPLNPLKYHYAAENSSLSDEDCAKLFEERIKTNRKKYEFESENTLIYHGSTIHRNPYIQNIFYADIYWEYKK